MYLYIYLSFERKGDKKRQINLSSTSLLSKYFQQPRVGQAQTRNQAPHTGLPLKLQGQKVLEHSPTTFPVTLAGRYVGSRKAGSSIQNAGTRTDSLIPYTTMLKQYNSFFTFCPSSPEYNHIQPPDLNEMLLVSIR